MKNLLTSIIVALAVFSVFYVTIGLCENTFDVMRWMEGNWKTSGIVLAIGLSWSVLMGVVMMITAKELTSKNT